MQRRLSKDRAEDGATAAGGERDGRRKRAKAGGRGGGPGAKKARL